MINKKISKIAISSLTVIWSCSFPLSGAYNSSYGSDLNSDMTRGSTYSNQSSRYYTPQSDSQGRTSQGYNPSGGQAGSYDQSRGYMQSWRNDQSGSQYNQGGSYDQNRGYNQSGRYGQENLGDAYDPTSSDSMQGGPYGQSSSQSTTTRQRTNPSGSYGQGQMQGGRYDQSTTRQEERGYSYGSQQERDHRFPQDTATNEQDKLLNKKIRDEISRGWLWDSYKEVVLTTRNGNVELSGTVKDRDDERSIIDKIGKINGVRAVKSRLNVERNR